VIMAKPTVDQVKSQIDNHEALCAERWGETLFRIKRLEAGALYAVTGVIGLLVTILLQVWNH
jgi:hypothetical protein